MAAIPHVVIIGGGFGGLRAARDLRRAPVRVTLIDRRNHHLFQPLLYEVATANLNPSDIATPLRKILRRQRNCTVLLGDVMAIDPDARLVILADETIPYDYLIVATGATHSYFGHDEWEALAPGLKSIEDALEIRRRVLLAFEAAEREDDPALRDEWLTFVIVGGGPTGVELAGTLAEISGRTLTRGDFRRCDPAAARLILLEGLPRILPTYDPVLSAKATRRLLERGVEVRTKALVTGVAPGRVLVGDEAIHTRTILWSAGVRASPLARSLAVPLDRAGRVRVRPPLTIADHDEVFVIGDLAAAVSDDGRPVPGVAPAAIQMGRHAARTIRRALDGKPPEPFHYADKGRLATIGRSAAVAQIGRLKVDGLVAWLLWLFVHILFLIGFRNRVAVLTEWAIAYFTSDRGARLITNEPHPLRLRGVSAEELAEEEEGAAPPEEPRPELQ
jgi:NADH:quinone reductase (non-electrogenic)